jgi:hypothetical protein
MEAKIKGVGKCHENYIHQFYNNKCFCGTFGTPSGEIQGIPQ